MPAREVEHNLYTERQLKTRHLVEAAYTVIKSAHDRYRSGEVSEEVAKRDALRTLSEMRYEDKEYFWVNDTRPQILMHPLNPALTKQDLQVDNPKLHTLFSAFSDTAKQHEQGGFYDYEWSKPGEDPNTLFTKTSYLKLFKPWGWVVGSGIYIDDVQAAYHATLRAELIKATGILAVLMLVSFLITRDLTRSLHTVCDNLDRLANGSTNVESSHTDRRDEVGDLARAFDIFKRNAIEKMRLEEESRQASAKRAEDRRQSMLELADRFDRKVGGIATSVQQAADLMQAMAASLSQNIQAATEQSSIAAASSEEASASVGSVAAATEELTASIREIAGNIARTANTTRDCAVEATASQEKLAALRQAVEEIDSVISAINGVAAQTNLLALNATIEAARAGEMGKGFSVVASEVKQLAGKTRQMTDEIANKVVNIKESASDAINTVDSIIRDITAVDQVTNQIAAAVEEQNVATQEISRNVQEASTGTGEVSRSITGVLRSGERSAESTEELKRSSDQLATQANELKLAVDDFLAEVRA